MDPSVNGVYESYKEAKERIALEDTLRYMLDKRGFSIKHVKGIHAEKLVGSNPNPTMGILKEIEKFLMLEEHQEKYANNLFKQIHDLHEEARDRKFAQSLYTEENLITVQNLFDLCVRYKFDPEIINKVNFLQDHWYKKVKEEEEKERKASEIVTIVLTKYFETKKYDDKEIIENNEKNVEIGKKEEKNNC